MICEVSLNQFIPEVRLFHSRKKWRRYLRSIGCDMEPHDGPESQTAFLSKGSEMKAVVLFEADCDWHSEAALLAHEAVHIASDCLNQCGFDPADQEILAYMVQSVSESLFRAHEEWKRKHGLLAG